MRKFSRAVAAVATVAKAAASSMRTSVVVEAAGGVSGRAVCVVGGVAVGDVRADGEVMQASCGWRGAAEIDGGDDGNMVRLVW
ncbi:hypothetical protein ACLOJK_004042 [Asimina triloba]